MHTCTQHGQMILLYTTTFLSDTKTCSRLTAQMLGSAVCLFHQPSSLLSLTHIETTKPHRQARQRATMDQLCLLLSPAIHCQCDEL